MFRCGQDFVDLLLPTVRSMEGGEEQVVARRPRRCVCWAGGGCNSPRQPCSLYTKWLDKVPPGEGYCIPDDHTAFARVGTVLREVRDSMSLEWDLIGPVIQSGMLTSCLDTVEILALLCSKGVKGEDESEKESEVKETAQDLPITLCFCNAGWMHYQHFRVHECHCQRASEVLQKLFADWTKVVFQEPFPSPWTGKKKPPQLAQI